MNSAMDAFNNLIEQGQRQFESDALAKAAAAGKGPNGALRMVLMSFVDNFDGGALVVDLDALPSPLALDLRTRLAAGLIEFYTDGATRDALVAAAVRSRPVTVEADLTVICDD